MRAFLGIGLPPEIRKGIADLVSPVRAKRDPVSWVPERNLHLTLKFLGEVPPARTAELAALVADASRDVAPFELLIGDPGGFPTLRAPRVLWVGFREPLELVRKLHQNMENALSGAGFPRDERPFHPHVTIGRVKGRVAQGWGERYAAAIPGGKFDAFLVTSCRLYESRLSPTGANYQVLREIPFGGAGADSADGRGAGG